jgi:hypothetical protein
MKKAALAILFPALICATASIPASAGTLYANANTDPNYVPYQITGFTISGDYSSNMPYSVSDSFTVSADSTGTSVTIVVWTFYPDVPTGVNWSIGTTSLPLGNGTTAATTGSYLMQNGIGYDIYSETFDIGSVGLLVGQTYYLTLDNAQSAQGDGVFWDENDGPSNASGSDTGQPTIGSETFYIDGTPGLPAPTPEPSSFLLLGTGVAGFAGLIRRKLKS